MDLLSAVVEATAYTPTDLGTDLAAGATAIIGWVGAGVGAGVVVMLALIGIRRGIGAFRGAAK